MNKKNPQIYNLRNVKVEITLPKDLQKISEEELKISLLCYLELKILELKGLNTRSVIFPEFGWIIKYKKYD